MFCIYSDFWSRLPLMKGYYFSSQVLHLKSSCIPLIKGTVGTVSTIKLCKRKTTVRPKFWSLKFDSMSIKYSSCAVYTDPFHLICRFIKLLVKQLLYDSINTYLSIFYLLHSFLGHTICFPPRFYILSCHKKCIRNMRRKKLNKFYF